MKKILCKLKSCKRAKTCKQKDDPFKDGKLCWGYENYINQDIPKNIKQYEVLFSEININLDRIQAKIFEPVYLNKRNEIIKMFFFGRVSVGDISEHLQCSPQYIYSVLKICRNKLLKDVVEP